MTDTFRFDLTLNKLVLSLFTILNFLWTTKTLKVIQLMPIYVCVLIFQFQFIEYFVQIWVREFLIILTQLCFQCFELYLKTTCITTVIIFEFHKSNYLYHRLVNIFQNYYQTTPHYYYCNIILVFQLSHCSFG